MAIDLPLAVATLLCCMAGLLAQRAAAERARLRARLEELVARELELKQAVETCPTTGLQNRIAFSAELEDIIARGDQCRAAVFFMDLDRFKEVNDSLGHRVGDRLLRAVALRLRDLMTPGDTLARIGGDEFAAIVWTNAARSLEDRALAIVEAVYEPFNIDGHLVHVATSVGVAQGSVETTCATDLLRQADIAMYDAKGSQTGSFKIFDERMSEMVAARTSMRAELEHALATNELMLKFQPVIEARTGALASAEALLRWPHPVRGDISPMKLIPMAEESGQILELGEWVLDKALEAARSLGDLPIAVNVSPVQFRHYGFAKLVGDKLLAHQVAPKLLKIEITEGVLITHMEAAKSTIRQLRQIGVQVVLDDFGTGYSSLSYLQGLDLDCMKIDKSFLRHLGQRPLATQIIRSVIDLGHSLELKVVAEGIENDWQARLLTLLNCDYLQGYYLGSPMPLEELARFKLDAGLAPQWTPDQAAPAKLRASN
jgi:diguanylate cyclase (GGDEF)-like protein